MRFLSAAALLLALSGGACATDDDALAKRPHSGSGSGGTGGSDAAAAAGGGGEGARDAADDRDVSGGADADSSDEPLPVGPGRLLLVHGVVDAPQVAFCFERMSAGLGTPLGAVQPSAGLAYARSFVLESIADFDAAHDALRPILLSGDLFLALGKTCAEALALAEPPEVPDATDAGDAASDAGDAASDAGPRLTASALPVLPAGTLYSARDVLLVAAGCIGGASHTDAVEQFLCGYDYRPDRPTLTALVAASATASVSGKTALQVMNGSLTSDTIDIVAVPPAPKSPIELVEDVVVGAIAPDPPLSAHSASELLTDTLDSLIEVRLGGSPAARVPWLTALDQAGLSALENGKSYAIVLLGPRAGYTAARWWLPSTVTIVATGQ